MLLFVLGSVLVGLFIAGRLLLSLDGEQDAEASNAARHEHGASRHPATEHANVTLVTCCPFYFVGDAPQRFIARAELADVLRSLE